MLQVNTEKDNNTLTVTLEGHLNADTAPGLEERINEELEGVTELCFDLKELVYISSAGLRVLLASQKKMNKQGSMVIKNVTKEVWDIMTITGFSDIFAFEQEE